MAKQLVPDTALFRLNIDRGADFRANNLIYVRNTVVGWTSAHLAGTADVIRDWWVANMAALTSSAYALTSISYEDLGADPGLVGELTDGTAGSAGADAIASIAALRVKFVGVGGFLPRQGANYVCGAVETAEGGDAFGTTYRGAVEDAYTALNSGINSFSALDAMVIVSRYLNGALRATGVTNQIADITCRTIVSKQSRRRRKTPLYVT